MEKLVSDMGRRGFDRMRWPRAATMIALASATGHARTLPGSRTGAGEMMPCSMHFLMLSVLRGFAVRLRPHYHRQFDAGVPLRDAQGAASHADPRTTMRYDRARTSLDRHATYIVATYIAGAAR